MVKIYLRRIAPVLLAAYFSATAVFGVSVHYSPVSLLVVVGLYLLLSFALYCGAASLIGRGHVLGVLGAFVLIFTAVWHFREQTFLPGSISDSLLLSAPISGLYYLLEVWLFDSGRSRPGWRRFVVSVLGFFVLWAGAYKVSPMIRWHLLRHNTMLGTPAYYLLDNSILSRQEALFEAHRDDQDPRRGAELPAPPPAAATQPNIVFVMLDTLRADALAAYGGDPDLMPRLNRFLAESFRFTDVLTNSSWTRSSVASFFTGLVPEEHGARLSSDPLDAVNVTLPEVLRQMGYATAAFVSNVAAISQEAGFSQGFDSFEEFQDLPYARAETVKRSLLDWLGTSSVSSVPWFLYVHLLDPHEPYLSGKEPKSKRSGEYWEAYREELRYLDHELGEMLDALQRELPAPTLFFITSDHGEEFFEHELLGHGYTLYNEVLRIPASLHTGQGGGVDITSRLEARDFFDLLSSVAVEDFEIEEWAHRRSRDRRYTSLYFDTQGRLMLRPYLRRMCTRALEEGGYKLVWSAYGDTYELYDLVSDPGETHNLAAIESERVKRMTDALDSQVRFWSFPEPFGLNEQALERMKALGYVQ